MSNDRFRRDSCRRTQAFESSSLPSCLAAFRFRIPTFCPQCSEQEPKNTRGLDPVMAGSDQHGGAVASSLTASLICTRTVLCASWFSWTQSSAACSPAFFWSHANGRTASGLYGFARTVLASSGSPAPAGKRASSLMAARREGQGINLTVTLKIIRSGIWMPSQLVVVVHLVWPGFRQVTSNLLIYPEAAVTGRSGHFQRARQVRHVTQGPLIALRLCLATPTAHGPTCQGTFAGLLPSLARAFPDLSALAVSL